MEHCSNCQQELTAGFDFCHHCGASVRTTVEAGPSKKNLIEVVDDLKLAASQTLAAGTAASQSFDLFLGSPVSIQRQILYALLTGLTLTLYGDATPLSAGVIPWLEGWLLISLFLLPVISYWVTGLLPFARAGNAILGDELSLRRRMIVALFWCNGLFGPRFLFTVWNEGVDAASRQSSSGDSLVHYLASYMVTFYLMGFTTYWRSIWGLEYSLFRNKMATEAQDVAERIREDIRKRGIRDLRLVETAMGKLRRYTAGESSGSQGSQMIVTRGRARIVLFVQDFGDGLFIRWSGHYDASGRRLWVFIGLIIRFINSITFRWTGTSLPEYWAAMVNALSPASGGKAQVVLGDAGYFSKMFGLTEGISEYGWNELYALEASIRETVVEVVSSAKSALEEADEIRLQIEQHSRFEALAGTPAGAAKSAKTV